MVGAMQPSMQGTGAMLRTRWLGTVGYEDAWALQRGLHRQAQHRESQRAGGDPAPDDHLLLLEHPHTYTLGRNADRSHVLVEPESVGAEEVSVDRGGDVTYHGPGQLVAYPLVTLCDSAGRTARDGALVDPVAWVSLLEQVVIDTLAQLGLSAGRNCGYPGVWVDPGAPSARKVAAVGVRVERGRTLHGVALNVKPDLAMFDNIVACGIAELGVTSLAAEGIEVSMRSTVDAFIDQFVRAWRPGATERSDVVWRERTDGADLSPFSRGAGPGKPTDGSNATPGARARGEVVQDRSPAAQQGTSVRLLGRLAEAGVSEGIAIGDPKPSWMRAVLHHDPAVLSVKRTVAELGLVTVCEEAGCPNLSECWAEGTATFMVNGERCTRACGFCLVDTRHPEPPSVHEPEHVAEAVARMGLDYAVVTTVARDDLADEGAGQIAATIRAIRSRCPGTLVEVLISDCRGRADALDVIFDELPDVLNHNIETVARLQRAARPSAGYARSLAVLSRSVARGLRTKSGLVLGMGENA